MANEKTKKVAVVAVGGNSLIKNKAHRTVPDQYAAAYETMVHIAGMISKGWDVVITHGNGPQVGFILRRAELAAAGFMRSRYPRGDRVHVPEGAL
jgi:carbamate kinase